MASTKDQVEAYGYESRRQVTSLLRGADEAGADPRRRINRGTAGGLVIAVLVVAGFGVAGWLGAGRGPALPDSGVIIVRGTGDRYVAVDGIVHPALNLASARLVGGGQVTEVSAEALGGKPRGLPIGIPNAPDALPGSGQLTNLPWTSCTVVDPGGAAPVVDLVIGAPVPAAGRLTGAAAIVIANAAGEQWLAMAGRRFPLAQEARRQLDLPLAQVLTLPDQVIATVPEGPRLAAPDVLGSGDRPAVPISGIAGVVGDVVTTSTPGIGDRFYLIQPDGLTPISPLVATLLIGAGGHASTVDTSVVSAAPESARPAPGNMAWPEPRPRPVQLVRGHPLCVSVTPGAAAGDAPWSVSVAMLPEVPRPAGFSPVATDDIQGVLRSVIMKPGTGAVVRAASAGGQDGTITLVTDAGMRYPIPPGEAAERLGYDPMTLKNVPKSFVDLLPAGPVLDPEAARKEFTGA